MDALAGEIGAKPDLMKIFKEDFKLGWKVFFFKLVIGHLKLR